MTKTLLSQIDGSVNFVTPASVGYFESRYVHRSESPYFICYLSSQSGCSKACRMCHLTATRQVESVDASIVDYVAQAEHVFTHWAALPQAPKRMHFNLMARGEPLANENLLANAREVFPTLISMAKKKGIESAKVLISTILPKTLKDINLASVLPHDTELYYSMYSVDPSFRRKWLPQAMSAVEGASKLADWYRDTGKLAKVHFAFIRGENDDEANVRWLCNVLLSYGLRPDVNIVRYNPPNDQSQESEGTVIESNAELIRTMLGSNVRMIPRVGFDVMASCGTFFTEHAA